VGAAVPAVEAKPPLMFPELLNGSALKGKVAIAHRGKQTFVNKAERLQAAGAVAVTLFTSLTSAHASHRCSMCFPLTRLVDQVIFVNDSDEYFRPAAPDSGVTINIPCVCLRKSEGEQLVSKLPANISIAPHQGLSVRMERRPAHTPLTPHTT
jgi:hypothetical protein